MWVPGPNASAKRVETAHESIYTFVSVAPRLPLALWRRPGWRRARAVARPTRVACHGRDREPRAFGFGADGSFAQRIASPRASQARHPALHERRREPDGLVRLQTRTAETPRAKVRSWHRRTGRSGH